MGPFRFRLQRVLGVRAGFEKQRAQDLAQAAAEKSVAISAHASAEARLASRRTASSLPTGEMMQAGMLHNLELTVHAASQEVDATKVALDTASGEVTRSSERYIEARRDRRVLERLREERLHSWTEDESRRDRRAMDDVAQVHGQRRHKRAA